MPRRALADDRPDDGRRGRDLQGGEQVRQRCGQAHLAVGSRRARRVGAHQLERARVRRAQAADHRDGHREEGQVRGHDDDAEPRSARRRRRSSARGPRSGWSGWRRRTGTNARSSSREWTKTVARTQAEDRPEREADERLAEGVERPRRAGTGRASPPCRAGPAGRDPSTMFHQWGRLRSLAKAQRNGGSQTTGAPGPSADRPPGTPPRNLTTSQTNRIAATNRTNWRIRRRREWRRSPAGRPSPTAAPVPVSEPGARDRRGVRPTGPAVIERSARDRAGRRCRARRR